MWKDPEARDSLRVQGAWSKRGGVAMMRRKEMEMTSLDSRKRPRSLMYPLPAHIAVFQDHLSHPHRSQSPQKEGFPSAFSSPPPFL